MKKTFTMKCLLAFMFTCLGTGQISAQKNIDKLVEELVQREDTSVNSVVKRNPETRKIERSIKSISLKDEKMAQRLIAAFEKDEEYAETAIKDMPRGRKDGKRVNFTFIFREKGEKRTYTLSVDGESNVSLSVIIKSGEEKSFSLNVGTNMNMDDFHSLREAFENGFTQSVVSN